jgi:hypothetical protein
MNRHEGYRNIESLSAESGPDSAGSLRVEMTRCGLCATASLHCPKTSHVRRSLAGPSGVGITVPCDRAHSVVVRAPYGLTATTASSSVDGRWRDVTVTHSPGFTVLITDNPLSGTLTRIVMY